MFSHASNRGSVLASEAAPGEQVLMSLDTDDPCKAWQLLQSVNKLF